ncbi:MAG: PEP-CTERM sorting domain-containing protein [Nitrospirae bacterium]|nr:PEP-CTERM sorting domain-containing protein [Nitrospirota bacterium]
MKTNSSTKLSLIKKEVKTMKRFSGIMIMMVAVLLLMANVQSANALTMTLDDGVAADLVTITSSTGIVSYTGAIGSFYFTMNGAVTKDALGSATDPMMSVTSHFNTTKGGTLTVTISEDGFGPTPSIGGFMNSLGGSTYGNATISDATYINGTLLYTGTYGGSFSDIQSSAFSTPDTYPITEVLKISAPGNSGGSIDANMQPVPEPSTFLLLGLGLCGVPFLRKKFRSNS